MKCNKNDDLDHAAEDLGKAAEAFAERLMGADTGHHLRMAAKHAIKAVRSALDEAERKLDERDERDEKADEPAPNAEP